MTTTRYSCPLDCGWHHDQDNDPPTADLAGMFGPALAGQITAARQRDQVMAVEGALREHCESHTLEQWLGALVAVRDRAVRAERAVVAVDTALARAEAERDRLAAGVPLVCSDDRHQARVRGLEAALARVREYCGLLDGSCRPAARETARDVLDLLDGRLGAEGEAVPPAAGSGADGEQRWGYAGESERNPDGTCPDWCPCHRMRADGGQR